LLIGVSLIILMAFVNRILQVIMLASPKASDIQKFQLENEYILPTVELIYELLKDLKFKEEVLKARLTSLLELITVKGNITGASQKCEFHQPDIDLENSIKRILGSMPKVLFDDIYRPLHKLLHEFYLNQVPDKAEDIAHNEALNAKTQQIGAISREELFEQTVQLFGTLKKRLDKIGPDIDKDDLKQLVVTAINNAKEKVLLPKVEVAPLLSPPRTFVPAAKDPRFLRQRQIAEEERLSELLLKQLQEEEDAITAQMLAEENEDVRRTGRAAARRPNS
jgi:hypothetical protein